VPTPAGKRVAMLTQPLLRHADGRRKTTSNTDPDYHWCSGSRSTH
jgi:hypothetical protein